MSSGFVDWIGGPSSRFLFTNQAANPGFLITRNI